VRDDGGESGYSSQYHLNLPNFVRQGVAMPKILPSQVVQAIDSLFGANRNELDGRAVTHVYRAEVHTLLTFLDEVPKELIDLPSVEYLEFARCRAVLATTLVQWNLGAITPARSLVSVP
jgi:hypothetical protein